MQNCCGTVSSNTAYYHKKYNIRYYKIISFVLCDLCKFFRINYSNME